MKDEIDAELIEEASRNIGKISEAITPFLSQPGQDAAGVSVACLTEAVMGNTAGLMAIADAINNLAETIRHDTNL